MNRAYSLFEVKDFDEARGVVAGTATTITTDRMGDIVEPRGAVFKLPLTMLMDHMTGLPVGHVIEAKAHKDRVDVVTQLVDPAKARSDTVRERLLTAWDEVSLKLKRAFSIGFQPIQQEPIKNTFGVRFTEWEWLELSLVTIPANAEATISFVKSLETELRVASDQRRGIVRIDIDQWRASQHPGAIYRP
jgi:hypothetical protein